MEMEKTIFVQKSKLLNGVLRYSSLDERVKRFAYLDSYGTLRNRDKINEFDKFIKNSGYALKFEDKDVEVIYNNLNSFTTEKFVSSSPFLKENDLYPFQHAGLNYSWERLHSEHPRLLIQWDTGAGKTLFSCLTSQRMFDEDEIDLVLVFCKKVKQFDWVKEFKRMTTLSVNRVSEKLVRDKRHDFYKANNSQVLVMNYEKAREGNLVKVKGKRNKVRSYDRTDLIQLFEMVKDKRVLIIIDEAQKINSGSSLLGEGFFNLINNSSANIKTIALTATPYSVSPLNIRNIFSIVEPGIPDVSDMKPDTFKRMYGKEFGYFQSGYVQELYVNEWDKTKLPLLGKKHENWTHIAMKSDPIIAAQFPENVPKKIIYELSDIDREIYDWAEQRAREKYNPENGAANWSYVDMLRMICNTTAGIRNSDSKFAKEILAEFGDMISMENSAKYQLIENNIEEYMEKDEKVVLFTYWTNGTLFPYYEVINKKFGKDALVLPVWGVGMDSEVANDHVEKFNSAKGGAILLTSDVLQDGVNLYAPYLWNIETPRTYLEYKQRKERINRADSKSKGIDHTWVFRTEAVDTIEERNDAKMLRRKGEAELIRGVKDEDTEEEMNDTIDKTPYGYLFK